MPPRASVAELHERWRDEGYLVLPRFFHALAVQRLRQLCDGVLARWRAARDAAGDSTNLAEMTDARWWQGRDEDLVAFLELVAEPRVLALAEALTGAVPLLQGTQYFMEPLGRSWTGAWHRDSQFLAGPGRSEATIRAAFTGLHARVALVADDNLELLPGSQARDDRPAEARARRDGDDSDLPDARRIALEPGDLCLFDAWMLHRGHYRAGRPRRTFDLVLAAGGRCDWSPPPADSLAPAARLGARLSAGAAGFFQRTRAAYAVAGPRPLSH